MPAMIVEDPTRERVQMADVGGGIEIAYEAFGDPTDPTMLLVMGLGMQMLAWDEEFCDGLVARGFHVVRFDNRDIGLSTKVGGGPPNVIAGALGIDRLLPVHAQRHGGRRRRRCSTASGSSAPTSPGPRWAA